VTVAEVRDAIGRGLRRPEGVAVGPDGAVWASDLGGLVVRIDPTSSVVERVGEPAAEPNGLTFDSRGLLVVCDFGGGRLVRLDPDTGRAKVILDAVDGRPLSRPNFTAFDRDGVLWCTCSTVRDDLLAAVEEQTDDGYLVAVLPDGRAEVAAIGLHFPNGCAVSPDGSHLVVVESGLRRLWCAELRGDGRIGPPRHVGPELAAVPDGIAFDVHGGIWVTLVFPRAGIVRVATDGTVEAVVDGGVGLPTNVAFGGADLRTVFVGSLDRESIGVLDADVAGVALAATG